MAHDPYAILSINGYAVFMGYLSMAVKGLGFLILTWTTVVLLGGFVSALQKKDFWCLTFITLVQTAGIFDVYLNEKLSNISNSVRGFHAASLFAFVDETFPRGAFTVAFCVRIMLAAIFLVIQTLVFVIVLCPLAAVYVFGVLISAGISLWRLIQHDYGGNSDEQANLKPAMDALYCLALLQGVLFFYRFIYARMGKRIAKKLIDICGKDELVAVSTYLRETRIGCEKNPSFARGRNFITYAVDMIGSKSPDDCLSGVQFLYTAICIWERRLKKARDDFMKSRIHWRYGDFSMQQRVYRVMYNGDWEEKVINDKKEYCLRLLKEIIEQHMLMKNLIMSASSSPILQKLLHMLNPLGAHDREIRNQAARIVAYLALDIHLDKFPQEIQYISTLIGTFEEYRLIEPNHRDRLIHKYDQYFLTVEYDQRQASHLLSPAAKDEDKLQQAYEKLVLRGLCILRKLATDVNNCRIMSETQDLLLRIMAPLTSDLIHQFNVGTWSISVVEGSLKVARLMVAAPGETGARMRREISNNKEAVCTMERILNCNDCHVKLKKQAMGILIRLYMDTKSRPTFIKMLVDIFAAGDNRDRSIRKLAGEALAKLCFQNGSNTGIILKVDGDVVGSLTKILLDAEDKTCRIIAAKILEHMCDICHTQDDECISKLKKSMTTTMPRVLEQILCCELAKDETHARTEADHFDDIENQIYNQHAPYRSSSSTHPEYKEDEWEVDVEEDESEKEEDEEFRPPLLSLYVMVYDSFISADQDLARQFEAISLPKKLKEMVRKNSIQTVCCLRLMKLTCKMVILMMKHSGSYVKKDLDSLMNTLLSASDHICHLDASMVFASKDDGTTTMKPVRSLVSLVKEAKESVETRRATEAHKSEYMEPSTSGPRQ